MACRKAAYRALTEVSEWVEQQQEKAAAKLAALEKEQEKIWTPTAVFQTCCTQWLADGAEILGQHSSNNNALLAKKGCSGGCGKDHPRITLDFETGRQAARALLSHELDPFVQYFDALCDKGLAKKVKPKEYQLTGFLQMHFEKLESTASFGSHLVKVSATALAASKRAHERQMEKEELELVAKRRKVQGPAVNREVLESVLEICWGHCLQEHLDLAEIAWMRVSCKGMAKFAARMALSRLQNIRLSYSVLVDGMLGCQEEDSNHDGESEQEGCCILSHDGRSGQMERYNVVASHAPLSSTEATGRFVPAELTHFEWDSTRMEGDAEHLYRGHLIRVYLEGAQITGSINSSTPENDCLFTNPLEVARYRIDPRGIHEGVHESSNLTYNVTSSTVTSTTTGGSSTVQYRGTFSIQSIQFNFNDLLGIYVRKKLPLEKQKMQEVRRKRPISRAEKDYVRALAKAAREAPGSSQAFQGMAGW